MEVKELRIGNWVIDADDDDRLLKIPTGEDIDFAADYSPIPLTEEWLLKFGFEKWPWCNDAAFIPLFFGDSLYCRYYNDKWHLRTMKVGRDKDGVYGKTNGRAVIPSGKIKHVHQIQNLYFALTGKELEMKTDV